MSGTGSLKERRIESDARIIASAVRVFGKNGYTFSSISDIAKGAGITAGLITQRFGTKENLFAAAYEKALTGVFTEAAEDASPRECLLAIIDDIQRMSEEAPDSFEFCYMLHSSFDYPMEVLSPFHEKMKNCSAYRTLKAAQEKGMLPDCDLDTLLATFGASVFQNTRMHKRYKLDYTDPGLYLKSIHFVDSVAKHDEKWHRILETAIANTFDVLIYVDLKHNKAEMLRSSDAFKGFHESDDVRKATYLMVQNDVPEEERQRIFSYLDPDTLSERLKGRKSISCKYLTVNGNQYTHTYLPVTRDENGVLTEVLAGVYLRSDTAQNGGL